MSDEALTKASGALAFEGCDYRTCLKCAQTKHVSCFSTYTAGGLNKWCVVCVAASEAQSFQKGATAANDANVHRKARRTRGR